jgi:hypothetical protein
VQYRLAGPRVKCDLIRRIGVLAADRTAQAGAAVVAALVVAAAFREAALAA